MEEKNEDFMMEENNKESTVEETKEEATMAEENNEESTSIFKKLLNKKILFPVAAGVCCVGAAVGIILAPSCKNNGGEKDTFTYSFNVMGGATIEQVTLEKGAEYTLPTPAAREGYTFEGWYLNESFEGAPVTSVVVEANQTYYAKWVQLAKIVVEIDGAETIVYAKAGEKVYDVLQSYIPSKSGLTFGAWFSNGKAVEKTTVISQNGLTVTPKFKVAYTIEIYTQKDDGTYTIDDTIEGTEYVGEKYTSTQTKAGYAENTTHADRMVEKVLGDKASENVFKHFFNPKTYTVTFIANKPDGTFAEEYVETRKYGDPIYMPNDYTAEGYCLIGWARDKNDKTPEFNAYAVDALLQNKPDDFTARESDIFEPNENDLENVTLFGIWAKGYIDMFGGDDYIYLLEEEDGKTAAYLSRGNVFFKGEYDEDYDEFYFMDSAGNYILNGKFYANNTFAYFSEKRSGYIAYLYSVGQGTDNSVQIEFDNANGITYKVAGKEPTIGTQSVNENGEYIADFTQATSGYMMGKTITFITGTYDNNNAFIMLNEEERDMGTLQRFYYNQARNSIMAYPVGMADIEMNGYGVATYTSSNGASNYYYTYENGVITLTSQYGGLFGEAIVTTIQGEVGYVLYTKWQDTELKIADGVTLKMDGGINAVYTNGSEVIEGYYTAENSNFGGYIIKMTSLENEEFTFMVNGTLDDEGALQIGYKVEIKNDYYGEYRYLSEGMVYNAALVVIEDEDTLSLYGFNKRSNGFVKVSDGTYAPVADEEGYYTYVVENTYPTEDIITDPVNPSAVKSFKFALDSETTSYKIFYWESMTDNNDVETHYVTEYKCATAAVNTTLKLVGGFAYYTLEGVPYSGPYALYEEEGYIMVLASDATGSKTFYVAINDMDNTFVPLQYQPYTAYLYGADGKVCNTEDNSISMKFDGQGNAIYTENDGTPVNGTIEEIGKEQDSIVYQFTSADLSFKYLIANVGNTSIFIRYNDTYEEEYISGNAMLELNGYGTYGVYEVGNKTYSGRYLVVEENVISLTDDESGKTFYFDIDGTGFTVRSEEYGSYLWIDNQQWIQETYFELDGYGKLLVYTLKEVDNDGKVTYEREYIDDNGTYTKNGKVFTLTWNNGDNTLVGELGKYYTSDAFLVKLDASNQSIGLYINEKDWSVLMLDDIGNAIKYAEEGEKEVGYYTLITENLLYYVNAANTDACLYVYDMENRTATQVKYADKTRYLTESMETLTFYEYGYLVTVDKEGNKDRHYYQKDGANVIIYVSSPEDVNANAYGFVTQTLNGFTSTLSFGVNGEKEYFKNDDTTLTFAREEATKDKYPILNGGMTYALTELIFDASSDVEFKEKGYVTLMVDGVEDKAECVVQREIDEDGNEKTYVLVSDYRFEVQLTFGSNSTYTIVGMEIYKVAYSNSYLNAYAYYAGFGYNIENTIGEITVHGSYNEDGTPEAILVDATFLEDSGMKDDYGNLVEFKDAVYEEYEEYFRATFTVENESAGEGLEDSYTYSLYFAMGRHKQIAAYAFNVVALARHQTFTEGEYEILAERVIATEVIAFENGDLFNVTIKKNGEDLGGSLVKSKGVIQFVDGKGLYVVRTKDGDKYAGATYYEVVVESDPVVDAVDGETKVPMYKAVSVTEKATVTNILYSIDDKYFADFTADGVGVITLVNETFVATGSEEIAEADLHDMYKPTDGATIVTTYKVTTTAIGRNFIVQIRSKDGKTYLYVQEVLDEV